MYRLVKGIFFTFFILTSLNSFAAPTGDFVTTWDTTNTLAGSTNPTSIRILTKPGLAYNYRVDWNNDGDFLDADETIFLTGPHTHNYGAGNGGIKQIRIRGAFPAIYFNYTAERNKILSIDEWGTNTWATMNKAFAGCQNLELKATDTPDLSSAINLNQMFSSAIAIGTPASTGNWVWDTSNISNFSNLFFGATAFDQNLELWDLQSAMSMSNMFQSTILSTTNYDAMLIAWDAQTLVNTLSFGGGSAIYCSTAAQAAHTSLASIWTISDGGLCNQAPDITSDGGAATASVNADENQTSVTTVMATDLETDPITYSISGGTDAADFSIDTSLGTLTFNSAPDFEVKNTYVVEVKAADNIAPNEFSTQLITVNVQDINEAPTITSSASVNVDENQTTVTTVTVSDPESNSQTFSISGGIDSASFSINSTTGDLTFVAAPDFETKSSYIIQVKATDDIAPNPFDTQTITVTINDINEAPSITSNGGSATASLSVDENQTTVTTVSANDPESNSITFSISGGTDSASFGINGTTGVLTFNSAPDFETKNIYVVEVTATDSIAPNPTHSQTITLSINDVNEAPIITSNGGGATTSINVDENQASVTTVIANDPELGSLLFSLSGGVDSPNFSIGGTTGVLTFISPLPDFETKNTYFVEVTVAENVSPFLSDTQTITVNIQDVNEAPTFTLPTSNSTFAIDVAENQTAVTTFSASDPDSDTVTYEITGGVDSASFAIGLNSGVLSFQTAPDFETQNIYIVEIFALDPDGLSDIITLTINITDVIESTATDRFVTTWQTDFNDPGNTTITIPTNSSLSNNYNYNVDWNGDGDFDDSEENIIYTGDATHTYATAGTYTVKIQGDFPGIYFISMGDKDKILSVEQWGTQQWKFMNNAFYGASNLVINATDIPDLSITPNLVGTFRNCTNIGNGTGVWNWDTTGINNMSSTFEGASSFDKDISAWVTDNVSSMSNMFSGAASFNQDISGWNTGLVLSMAKMFFQASIFNQNISTWDTKNVTDMQYIFNQATAFNQPIGNWDTSKVTTMYLTFAGDISFNQDLSGWDTSSVTDMRNMFINNTAFNGNISTWNTSKVTKMSLMFSGASAFNQPINYNSANNYWNTLLVKDFDSMFENATAFNQDIGLWNTASATDMSRMFSGATAFNQNIGLWNTALATDMSQMFSGATTFDQDIGAWQTGNVTTMAIMFNAASAFNQNIDAWDVSNVESMAAMFSFASAFNQPLNNWQINTTNVSMLNMFSNAVSFNQDISNWNIEAVTSFSGIFSNAPLSIANYDALLISWDAQNLPTSKFFTANKARYCSQAAITARANIINNDNWSISDDGECNHAPTLTSSSSYNIDENLQDVTTILASDPDGDFISYSITAGADMDKFELIGALLRFKVKPDYEQFASAANDNTYFVEVTATDNDSNSLSDSLLITINVQDLADNKAPIITSNNGFSAVTISIDENTTAVTIVAATDPENDILKFSISSGNDQLLFTINEDTGVLAFKVAPDYEAFGSSNGSNFYKVNVTVTDNGNPILSDTQNITVSVNNVVDNTAPYVTGGTFLNTPENQTLVKTITAKDDENDTVFFEINGTGADDTLFEIGFNSGDLSFIVKPDFEIPGSQAGTNIYEVEVKVLDDGSPVESSTKIFTITITDVLEYQPSDHFVTTWKTDNPGTSSPTSITIPNVQFGTNYIVDWNNDGDFDDVDENIHYSGDATHDYGIAGTYTVRIEGIFNKIDFSGNEKEKIVSVDQWGTTQWTSLFYAFKGCANLVINASDTPDLSNVNSLGLFGMFQSASLLGNGTGNWNWDILSITSLSSMFKNASNFNKDISNWTTSNVTKMSNMFQGASVFNQDIGNWDTNQVETMAVMFSQATVFNQDVSSWNIEKVTNFSNMFSGATLSTTNYDNLLIGWNNQNLSQNEAFNAGNSKYCSQAAIDAHNNLTNNDGWFISDLGVTTSCFANIDLAITIVDNTTSVFANETIDYEITITNIGVDDAIASKITDVIPAQIVSTTWSCSATGSATCNASGTGQLNETVNIPSGDSVIFTVSATMTNDLFTEVVYSVNTSTLTQTDVDLSNNTASDTNTNEDIVYKNGFEDL